MKNICLFSLMVLISFIPPTPVIARVKTFVCCKVKDHNKPHKCSNGTPCNDQCDHKICGHSASSDSSRLGESVESKNSLTQQDQKKEYPKLEGKDECYNYRIPGKKINCACSHTCDLEKGDPKNRYIMPGSEDYKCSNHCKKHMCKCKTKCQT